MENKKQQLQKKEMNCSIGCLLFVFDTNISLADLFLSLSFLCKCSFPFLYFFSTGKSTVHHHK